MPNLTMNNLVKTVKATIGISVVGVSEDPGSKDKVGKETEVDF
jgi:hypothetical protein